jgi:hypothetical protein
MGCGQGAIIVDEEMGRTTKIWRGFVDKTEARVVSGSVQLYSGVVSSSKDDMYTKWGENPSSEQKY